MAQQSDFNALFPPKSSDTVQKRNPDSTVEDCIPDSQMSNSRDVQWANCFDSVKAMWLIFFTAPVMFSSWPCSVICPPVYCCLPTPNSNFPENKDHDCLVFCSFWSFHWAHRRCKNWLRHLWWSWRLTRMLLSALKLTSSESSYFQDSEIRAASPSLPCS